MWLQLVIFVLFLFILWYYLTRPPPNHPTMPPMRFPIIGHFPYLIGYKHLQEAANDLMEKYGQNGMLSIFLGPRIKGGIIQHIHISSIRLFSTKLGIQTFAFTYIVYVYQIEGSIELNNL